MTSEIQRLMTKKQRLGKNFLTAQMCDPSMADMELWQTEKQICDLETTYLEETETVRPCECSILSLCAVECGTS